MRLLRIFNGLLFSLINCNNINPTVSQCTNLRIPMTDNNNIKVDYNKPNVKFEDDQLFLSLTQLSGGTRISIGDLWFPSVNTTIHFSVSLRISKGSNVVTAPILMADNGDEIDFEFVGWDKRTIQTNYFYRGIPLYTRNAIYYQSQQDLTNTWNTYTIIWGSDYYKWMFGESVLRTLYKNKTITYPNSPSRFQIGIWKAGVSPWGGRGINWTEQPFNISIRSISVTCDNVNYQSPSATTKTSTTITTKTSTTISTVTSTPNTGIRTRNTANPNPHQNTLLSLLPLLLPLLYYFPY